MSSEFLNLRHAISKKYTAATKRITLTIAAHAIQFLSEIINICNDVFSLQFSDGLTLSWHNLNAIWQQMGKLEFLYFVFFALIVCMISGGRRRRELAVHDCRHRAFGQRVCHLTADVTPAVCPLVPMRVAGRVG